MKGYTPKKDYTKEGSSSMRHKIEQIVEKANERLSTTSCNSFNHYQMPCEGLFIDDDGFICCAHNDCPGVRCGLIGDERLLADEYEHELTI